MKNTLSDENENSSCSVANAHMLQSKHMISFNKIFDFKKTGKCWHKRNAIIQSWYIGTYISPKFKKSYTKIEEDDIFPLINMEHLYTDHVSYNNPACFDEINIYEI